MPVARLTTSAISSAPTWVRSRRLGWCAPCAASLAWASFELLFQLGQLAVLQLGHLVEVALALEFLDRSLTCRVPRAHAGCPGPGPFLLPDFVEVGDFLLQGRDLFLDQAKTLCEASSFSFFTASRSICNWIRRRSSLSITSGLESISILILEAASSIRSMALSGRKRSVM